MESDIRNVIICGIGAIGSIYADKIHNKTPNNLRVLVDNERKERYTQNPMIFNGKPLNFNYILPSEDNFKADLIIIATKSNGLDDSIKNIKNFIKDDTIILSLLNGVTSEEIIAEEYGWDKLLLSFFLGHSAIRDGRSIIHDDVNFIYFGEKDSCNTFSDKALRVKNYFDKMDIKYVMPPDMLYAQWLKFMLNLTGNQTSAILKMTFGEMQQNEHFQKFALSIMKEVVEIAKAVGVQNTEKLIPETIEIFHTMIPEGKTSMLQDVEAGRKTEVEIFAGTIVKLGEKYKIQTPYNKIMKEMIEIIHENQEVSKLQTKVCINS